MPNRIYEVSVVPQFLEEFLAFFEMEMPGDNVIITGENNVTWANPNYRLARVDESRSMSSKSLILPGEYITIKPVAGSEKTRVYVTETYFPFVIGYSDPMEAPTNPHHAPESIQIAREELARKLLKQDLRMHKLDQAVRQEVTNSVAERYQDHRLRSLEISREDTAETSLERRLRDLRERMAARRRELLRHGPAYSR